MKTLILALALAGAPAYATDFELDCHVFSMTQQNGKWNKAEFLNQVKSPSFKGDLGHSMKVDFPDPWANVSVYVQFGTTSFAENPDRQFPSFRAAFSTKKGEGKDIFFDLQQPAARTRLILRDIYQPDPQTILSFQCAATVVGPLATE